MSDISLVKALAAAQNKMQNAAFDSKSNFSKNGKNNYASLTAMRDATVPYLSENGIAISQGVIRIDNEMFMRTTLRKDGETIEEIVPMIIGKNDMHGVGSAMTYARRYGLGSICGIASDEDDDGDLAVANTSSTIEYVTIEQAKEISSEIDRLDADRKKFLQHFKVGELSQLTAEQFLTAKQMLGERERRAVADAAA